ncbi:hypothetical protein [Tenacibaculum amylolyticum]|uniref:hypothetical protein n=1 Tax=Tenacibaculum amylolyticum TaxID=104269 RepID=UPI0038960846
MERLIISIKQHRIYFVLLTLSLFFFARKAIQYAVLESYITSVILLLILTLISTSLLLNKRTKFALRFWSILLLIWSIIRVLLFIANAFLKEMSESHLYHQLFSPKGIITSSIFLFMSIYLFKNSGKV